MSILHSISRFGCLITVRGIPENHSPADWRGIFDGRSRPSAATGPMLRWSDGAIAYAFESYKDFRDCGPAKHGAWYIVLRDQGATFGSPVLVAQDPEAGIFYWDQRMRAGRAPGEYVSMFWKYDLKRKQDLPVHISTESLNPSQMPIQFPPS